MDNRKLVVLISGNGSNLQAIIDATKNNTLPYCEISAVISNKKSAFGLERARKHSIADVYFPKMKVQSREEYDSLLAEKVSEYSPDLIVLAGWMRILTPNFISKFESGKIINLHPALPGEFPGADGIGDAFQAYKEGKITQSGLMVHEVIEELDAGKVITTQTVPLFKEDTLEEFRKRVKSFEKLALVKAIFQKLFGEEKQNNNDDYYVLHRGKVRDLLQLNDKTLALVHTDRLSSFDRHICDVEGKGEMLCNIASWWFSQNHFKSHYLNHFDNIMIVKKCTPIKLEVVVRNYITGSTNTSLWTHYQKGVRNYCGNIIPDGLVKNQKLPETIITPTTKDEHDEPISPEEIVNRKIVTQKEWSFISKMAMAMFAIGSQIYAERGLILVDTKYEFGYDGSGSGSGSIVFIDEVHTPDSSRFWKLNSYQERFNQHLEPERLDKDVIREYLKSLEDFDPYDLNTPVPEIPQGLKTKVQHAYKEVYNRLKFKHNKI